MLRTVTATRYVTPLREGGSLPGLVEADDLGIYVVKFTGAGQGRKALVAEVVVGELARSLGFRVPELVVVELDPVVAASEPDEEVQDLLRTSGGPNLGLDFLPGSVGYDALGGPIDALLASKVLWLDAFVSNVDRSWRNPNLLVWHGDLWLIDHGAALFFAHDWPRAAGKATRAHDSSEHVLVASATRLEEADHDLAPRITVDLVESVVALVPEEWLRDEPGFASSDEVRAAYVDHLMRRVAEPRTWWP